MYGSRGKVVRAGRPAAEHPPPFVGEFLFDARVLREQVPGPGQGQSRGLVAREVERHGLIAELAVAHLRPVLVLSGYQRGQEVVASGAARAARGDEPVHDLGERRDRPPQPQIGRRRQPERKLNRPIEPGGQKIERKPQAAVEPFPVALRLEAEQRLEGDRARQRAKFGFRRRRTCPDSSARASRW